MLARVMRLYELYVLSLCLLCSTDLWYSCVATSMRAIYADSLAIMPVQRDVYGPRSCRSQLSLACKHRLEHHTLDEVRFDPLRAVSYAVSAGR